MNATMNHFIVRRITGATSVNCLSNIPLKNPGNSLHQNKKNFVGKTVKVNTFSTQNGTGNPVSLCMFYQQHGIYLNSSWKKLQAASVTFPKRLFAVSTSMMERLKPDELKKRVDNLTDSFAEARELLGDARESLGSTYFSDDMMEAQEAVSSTVAKYQALLADLDEDQRNDVVRTIGLRMEELKAQEQAIKDLLD